MNPPVTPSTIPSENVRSSPEWQLKPLTLPTMYDLPSEDPEEPGLPNIYHGLQPQVLDETIFLPQYPADQVFSAFDLNLYYDPNQTRWYKRPDWFLCVGVPLLYKGLVKRWSYVMWEEKVAPTVVIEFLSEGTESEDLGRFWSKAPRSKRGTPPAKFVVYEEILKIPNYIVFDEDTQQLRFFRLVNDRYQEQAIEPTNPRLWIPEINLGLGLTTCTVRKIEGSWLRWCDQEGNFYPTPAESYQAETEVAKVETEAAKAETEAAKAEIEAAKAETEAVKAETEAAKAEIEAAKAETEAVKAQMEQQQQQSILSFLGLGLSSEQVSIALGVEISKVEAIRDR